MSDDDSDLWILTGNLALLSLVAVGGINPLLPELHRQAVDVYGWMTTTRFLEIFAVAQAAPGPNIQVVALLGFEVAGLAGAFLGLMAICVPSCSLAYLAIHVWQRSPEAKWRLAAQAGLAPITIGLVAAGGLLLTEAAGTNFATFAIVVVTAGVVYATKLHPLVCLAAGGLLGLSGVL